MLAGVPEEPLQWAEDVGNVCYGCQTAVRVIESKHLEQLETPQISPIRSRALVQSTAFKCLAKC
jgi:hypothetical protein